MGLVGIAAPRLTVMTGEGIWPSGETRAGSRLVAVRSQLGHRRSEPTVVSMVDTQFIVFKLAERGRLCGGIVIKEHRNVCELAHTYRGLGDRWPR